MENQTNINLSKKELRDAKYQEKMEKRQNREVWVRNKSYFIWGGVIVLLVLVIWGAIEAAPKNTDPMGVGKPDAISSSDWVLGNKDAKVSIIEYSDFQCPACAAYTSLLNKIIQDYGDNVVFVYRYFPLTSIHKTATISSMAAEAAGRQGKFWEMGNKLFENQSIWADSSKAQEIFTSYAQDLGLNINKFKSDLSSGEIKDKINTAYNKAQTMNLSYTPSIFINNKLIQNPRSYEEFKTIIESEIEANP
ncbi:MAG: protein-disulfide isomerase [Parcubacteria group bacterium GW2011_GWC1_39_29]|uniref:Na+/H+ antiporter, NhaA family protein, nonfunctional n=1 Tax=Candidatus Yanofskybacteria bacterium GW2011_GWD1_39_16 TaxID=1619030 RepID=A0A837HPF4_9BACT|nr:MAG: Na+/H+ antiporter, NhaA family protein, nonfunctional [Candidatus Yanofskybacteria bacterium GW2011_GWD1_39_16]KKR14500.1 MAG: protein-disulfide isomerase [Parcubacteria group bacterium GW2011_GWC1_39_29]